MSSVWILLLLISQHQPETQHQGWSLAAPSRASSSCKSQPSTLRHPCMSKQQQPAAVAVQSQRRNARAVEHKIVCRVPVVCSCRKKSRAGLRLIFATKNSCGECRRPARVAVATISNFEQNKTSPSCCLLFGLH
eukprot:376785-Amphidinium_carterae.1